MNGFILIFKFSVMKKRRVELHLESQLWPLLRRWWTSSLHWLTHQPLLKRKFQC